MPFFVEATLRRHPPVCPSHRRDHTLLRSPGPCPGLWDRGCICRETRHFRFAVAGPSRFLRSVPTGKTGVSLNAGGVPQVSPTRESLLRNSGFSFQNHNLLCSSILQNATCDSNFEFRNRLARVGYRSRQKIESAVGAAQLYARRRRGARLRRQAGPPQSAGTFKISGNRTRILFEIRSHDLKILVGSVVLDSDDAVVVRPYVIKGIPGLTGRALQLVTPNFVVELHDNGVLLWIVKGIVPVGWVLREIQRPRGVRILLNDNPDILGGGRRLGNRLACFSCRTR